MPAQPRPRLTVSTQRALTLAQHASRLRACATPSEVALWALLRGRQLGVEFRRQVVIGQRIVDFFAPAHRLAVEVDGGYHQGRSSADATRDSELRRQGVRVLHLTAEEVLTAPQLVVVRILAALRG